MAKKELLYKFLRESRCVHSLGNCGKQNSGLANFIMESCINHFHLPISKIALNQRVQSFMLSCFEEKEHAVGISIWNIPSCKTGLPFLIFSCSRRFSTGTTQKVVFCLLSNRIFRKLFVLGKQPEKPNQWRWLAYQSASQKKKSHHILFLPLKMVHKNCILLSSPSKFSSRQFSSTFCPDTNDMFKSVNGESDQS